MTMASPINRFRRFAAQAFRRVPQPPPEGIFDPSGDPILTKTLRRSLGGKRWRELSHGEAENWVSLHELNPSAYQYFVQAQLLGHYPNCQVGIPPEPAGLLTVWGRRRVDLLLAERRMTPQQAASLALFVELHGLLGDFDSQRAFESLWRDLAPEHFYDDPRTQPDQ